MAVNVEGTQRLLDAAAAAGVGRVVFSSSTSVYGHALEPRDAAAAAVLGYRPRHGVLDLLAAGHR